MNKYSRGAFNVVHMELGRGLGVAVFDEIIKCVRVKGPTTVVLIKKWFSILILRGKSQGQLAE